MTRWPLLLFLFSLSLIRCDASGAASISADGQTVIDGGFASDGAPQSGEQRLQRLEFLVADLQFQIAGLRAQIAAAAAPAAPPPVREPAAPEPPAPVEEPPTSSFSDPNVEDYFEVQAIREVSGTRSRAHAFVHSSDRSFAVRHAVCSRV